MLVTINALHQVFPISRALTSRLFHVLSSFHLLLFIFHSKFKKKLFFKSTLANAKYRNHSLFILNLFFLYKINELDSQNVLLV